MVPCSSPQLSAILPTAQESLYLRLQQTGSLLTFWWIQTEGMALASELAYLPFCGEQWCPATPARWLLPTWCTSLASIFSTWVLRFDTAFHQNLHMIEKNLWQREPRPLNLGSSSFHYQMVPVWEKCAPTHHVPWEQSADMGVSSGESAVLELGSTTGGLVLKRSLYPRCGKEGDWNLEDVIIYFTSSKNVSKDLLCWVRRGQSITSNLSRVSGIIGHIL